MTLVSTRYSPPQFPLHPYSPGQFPLRHYRLLRTYILVPLQVPLSPVVDVHVPDPIASVPFSWTAPCQVVVKLTPEKLPAVVALRAPEEEMDPVPP